MEIPRCEFTKKYSCPYGECTIMKPGEKQKIQNHLQNNCKYHKAATLSEKDCESIAQCQDAVKCKDMLLKNIQANYELEKTQHKTLKRNYAALKIQVAALKKRKVSTTTNITNNINNITIKMNIIPYERLTNGEWSWDQIQPILDDPQRAASELIKMHFFDNNKAPCMRIQNKHDTTVQVYQTLADNTCGWVSVSRRQHCDTLTNDAMEKLENYEELKESGLNKDGYDQTKQKYLWLAHQKYMRYVTCNGLDKDGYDKTSEYKVQRNLVDRAIVESSRKRTKT